MRITSVSAPIPAAQTSAAGVTSSPAETCARDSSEISLQALIKGAAVGGAGGSLAGLVAGSFAGHPLVGLLVGAGLTGLAGGGVACLRELSRLDARVVCGQKEAENQRLREELQILREQRPGNVTLDVERDLVRLQNLRTPELLVDSFELHVPHIGRTVADAVKVSELLSGNHTLPLDSLSGLLHGPLEVREGQARVPLEALNTIAGALKAPGISHLRLTPGENGTLAVTGQRDGMVDISFDLHTRIGREDDQRARLSIDEAKVWGWLPVPKLVTGLFGSMAAEKLRLEQRGDDYLFNVAAFIPPQLDLRLGLKDLTTRNGDVVINVGPGNQSSRRTQ